MKLLGISLLLRLVLSPSVHADCSAASRDDADTDQWLIDGAGVINIP